MFAVVKTGGKQYRVAVDDVIKVEKLAGDAGTRIELQEVLMVGDGQGVKVGTPLVAGVPVIGEVVAQTRGDKILVFKKKRRHQYRRRAGHRQDLTVLRIVGIGDVMAEAAAEKKVARKAAPKKAAKAEEATAEE